MRKTKLVTITAEGRDQNKGYLLREMPAMQAEKWATRALLALANSGVDLPPDFDPKTASSAQIITVGLEAFGKARWELMEPLLDEMMECVRYVGNPITAPEVSVPLVANEDAIEEVSTLLTIRRELLELHLGFSFAGRVKSSALSANKPPIGTPTSQL